MVEEVGEKRIGKQSVDVAGRTRRVIVEAALRLFAQRGFEGVSLRDIAERAGTTHGLIRHHFGSKEGVWRAVVDAADTEYVTALAPVLERAAAESDEAAAGTVTAILRGIVLVSARHPEIVRLLVHEGAKGGERLDYVLEHLVAPRRLLAPLVARLQRQGLLRQFDEDSFFLFLLTAGAMPFALPALSGGITGEDILSEEHASRHADRLITTLFNADGASFAE